MKYLLDTCTVSQFVRGNPGVSRRVKSTSPDDIAVSAVTCMEVEYGLQINPERASKIRPVIESFFNTVEMLSYTRQDADSTARIRAILKAKGTPIGPYDIMLAGCAWHRGLTMITDNLDEFQRVEGLTVENWVTRTQKPGRVRCAPGRTHPLPG